MLSLATLAVASGWVPASSGIKSLKDVAGKPICVETGTSTELNLADRMRELNATYTPLKFQSGDQTFAAYLQGRCVAVTSDRSQLAAKRTGFPNPAEHLLLPDMLSKEPLNPATINADPAWADAVRWVVYSLIQAEEMGITAANIDAKLAEAKANKNLAQLRRFLGVEGDLGKQLRVMVVLRESRSTSPLPRAAKRSEELRSR